MWGEVPEVCEDPGSAAPVSRASSADPEETEEEVEALNKKPVRNRCGNMHLTSAWSVDRLYEGQVTEWASMTWRGRQHGP